MATSLVPAWDFYAFAQAVALGGIAWLVTLWVTPLRDFRNWDWFFCLGVPAYVYLKNARSRDEKMEAMTGTTEAEQARVKMGPSEDKLAGLVMVKGRGGLQYGDHKATVLVSFSTSCAPSRSAFRGLQSTYKVFQDDGVMMLAVSKEDPETIRAFLEDQRGESNTVTFQVASDADGAMLRSLKKRLLVKNTPHAFIVTELGNVAWHGHPNALEGMLSAMLMQRES